ncbi:LamB/YcsF family protein [Pseudoxanthomonas sp. CAU 1598]|uniref:LamB/YcsF family protein n=1 Tax=Pseudomarimonas arenosa TaxID=2774145 RepID=A0AAW3ZPH2_9GAMM|nr:LamB/YcsF family protein [Pseudomarimonas arenosa]
MSIDLNADVGEGMASDAELIPLVSSANIACGAHAGDADTMRQAVKLCLQHGVRIGAHPGYVDPENFGRELHQLSDADLRGLIHAQLETLSAIVKAEGGSLSHVKPHGALYNQSAEDPRIATQIAYAIAAFDKKLVLIGLSGSHSLDCARTVGLRSAAEGFVERRYEDDGRLTPRSEPGAVIESRDEAVAQALAMTVHSRVQTREGKILPLLVDTLCLHGDRPDAAELARALRAALDKAGVRIEPPGRRERT